MDIREAARGIDVPLSLSDDANSSCMWQGDSQQICRKIAWQTANMAQNFSVIGDKYSARLFFKNTNHQIFLLEQSCTLDGVVVNIWSGAAWRKQINAMR
jgi:hypothetical protein